jgi:O-antigen/teichoic acid export membrane protein
VLALVKRTDIPMLNLTICGMINIALNWWLLPIYTYQVAAVSTLVCYVLLCIAQAFASRQFLHWSFPWKTAGRSMCSAILMYIGVLLLVRTSNLPSIGILIIAVPFGVLIYGIFIWIFDEISPEERSILKEYSRRFFVQKVA